MHTFKLENLEARRLLSAAATGDYVPGELLVGFKPGVDRAQIAQFYTQHGLSEREALDGYVRGNARRLKLVSVPAAQTLALATTLARDPRVAYAEPNYLMSGAALTPTDSQYPVQWNL